MTLWAQMGVGLEAEMRGFGAGIAVFKRYSWQSSIAGTVAADGPFYSF